MIFEERDDHIRPGKPGAFAACCLVERRNTRILVPTDVSPLQ
ncbi:hypothetical protein N7I30_02235 [Aurantimonas litoralis]|nr:hypothetical protein [Aurantimonas litoralis]